MVICTEAKVLAGRLICKLLPRLMRHQRIREAAGFHGGKRFWLIFLDVFLGKWEGHSLLKTGVLH